MTHNPSHESSDDETLATDGGVTEREAEVDYLDTEINILKPKTPFMRDHLKLVWVSFIAWTLLTWGPVVATYLAPGLMTQSIPLIEFPAHYFTVAFLAPTSSLVLAFIYSRKRDKLDEKYGIDHEAPIDGSEENTGPEDSVAADGGEEA